MQWRKNVTEKMFVVYIVQYVDIQVHSVFAVRCHCYE